MSSRSGGMNRQLVLLLVLLFGVGSWNFYNNTQLENAALRPFRKYSDANLEQLLAQYQSEKDSHSKRYQAVASNSTVRVRDRGLLGDQVNEFERVQQISQRRRGMADQVTDRQIALDQIRAEQGRREADRPVYKMFFRRLITF